MKTEPEFVADAQTWLRQRAGDDVGVVGPDVDLVRSGVLDSLLLVAFLTYLQDERGGPLPMAADSGITVEDFSTLRRAYDLVTRAG